MLILLAAAAAAPAASPMQDLPVTRRSDATFAFATLVGRAQDVGLQTPDLR
jgi:hypothetical protein